MTDNAFFNNYWDDELRDLSARVTALFGEDAVSEAVDRAGAALLVSEARPAPTFEQILTYRNAIKAELRRLIQPQ
jgi:hypothetical protein